jgi:hypothetical protein
MAAALDSRSFFEALPDKNRDIQESPPESRLVLRREAAGEDAESKGIAGFNQLDA